MFFVVFTIENLDAATCMTTETAPLSQDSSNYAIFLDGRVAERDAVGPRNVDGLPIERVRLESIRPTDRGAHIGGLWRVRR